MAECPTLDTLMTCEEAATSPQILKPVEDKLRVLHLNFNHAMMLTGKTLREPEGPPRCPSMEMLELHSRLPNFNAWLHTPSSIWPDGPTNKLEEAIEMAKRATTRMKLTFKLYEDLMKDSTSAPSFDPSNKSEWMLTYMTQYMLTCQRDIRADGQPKRRTQQEWHDVFTTAKRRKSKTETVDAIPSKLACHCTEASRRAAIKDATDEATEAATSFLEVALCLRQAAYLEVKERRDKLLDAENRARQLLSRSTRVTYEVTHRAAVQNPSNYA